jgi:hypothetical protein
LAEFSVRCLSVIHFLDRDFCKVPDRRERVLFLNLVIQKNRCILEKEGGTHRLPVSHWKLTHTGKRGMLLQRLQTRQKEGFMQERGMHSQKVIGITCRIVDAFHL